MTKKNNLNNLNDYYKLKKIDRSIIRKGKQYQKGYFDSQNYALPQPRNRQSLGGVPDISDTANVVSLWGKGNTESEENPSSAVKQKEHNGDKTNDQDQSAGFDPTEHSFSPENQQRVID